MGCRAHQVVQDQTGSLSCLERIRILGLSGRPCGSWHGLLARIELQDDLNFCFTSESTIFLSTATYRPLRRCHQVVQVTLLYIPLTRVDRLLHLTRVVFSGSDQPKSVLLRRVELLDL